MTVKPYCLKISLTSFQCHIFLHTNNQLFREVVVFQIVACLQRFQYRLVLVVFVVFRLDLSGILPFLEFCL